MWKLTETDVTSDVQLTLDPVYDEATRTEPHIGIVFLYIRQQAKG